MDQTFPSPTTAFRYIALLRGINVSGRNIVKMEALRKVLTDAGFENVTTYIQSGNILFRAKNPDRKIVEDTIVALIRTHFGLEISVIIISPEDLDTAIANNPFANDNLPAPQPYVAFLSAVPDNEKIALLNAVDFGSDRFVFIDKLMYLHYADSPATTRLSNAIIENRLRLRATARNWKTIHKLKELAAGM